MNIWIIIETIGLILTFWYFIDVNTDGDFDLPHYIWKVKYKRAYKRIKKLFKRWIK